jgi:ubiquinone/menaquinone biosynthesis C-methylase UbiE
MVGEGLQPEWVKEELKKKYDLVGNGIITRHQTELGQLPQEILQPRPTETYWMQRKISTAFEVGGFSKTDHLLEVGCTAGHYTLMLAREGYRVTGLDISPTSIEAARLLAKTLALPNAEFIAADVDEMRGIADNTFDGAFSFSTLRYVPDPVRSLREIRRVVRPGAGVAVDFPNKYCPWFNFLKFLAGGERHIHDHTYSTRQACTMLAQAGFINVEARRILFFAKQFPSVLLSTYKAMDRIGEATPGLNRLAGIVMCKGEKPRS